jgi:hypothetical protein
MTVYEVPATSPYQRTFRILAWGAIGILMGILIFSAYEPDGINDSTNHPLGWLAVAIVLSAIVGTTIFGVKEDSWKLMRKLRFEVSDGKIIEMRGGAPSQIIEIPLNQIESLGDHRRWFFVIGGTPRKRIAIPKEVRDFEVLKKELVVASARTPVKVQAKVHPLSLLPFLLMFLTCLLLYTSQVRAVVVAAGVSALALQAVGTYSLWKILRQTTASKMVIPACVLTWLLLVWLVYQRLSGGAS